MTCSPHLDPLDAAVAGAALKRVVRIARCGVIRARIRAEEAVAAAGVALSRTAPEESQAVSRHISNHTPRLAIIQSAVAAGALHTLTLAV